MPLIEHQEFIQASVERCFDLARDVDIDTRTTEGTKEKAVGGVTTVYCWPGILSHGRPFISG